jgi:hypothetical protein
VRRKCRVLAIVALLVAAPPSSGAGSLLSETDFEVEDAILSSADSESAEFATASLPEDVRAILVRDHYGPYYGVQQLPASVEGFVFDLNGDGSEERFLETPLGGSSAPFYIVVAEIEGTWRVVLGFQGWFHILPSKTGWCPILTTARLGPQEYRRTWHEFRDGAYREVSRTEIRGE